MTAKLVAALTLAVTLVWTAPSFAAGSKEAGQAKAATCSACHGMDGNSVNPEWPNLAGQHETYILKQLNAFHGGKRQNPLMSPMAAILSEQDMADLAAYFSSQTIRGGETDPSKAKLGQHVYRSGNVEGEVMACAGCHGPTGAGIPKQYPRIAGQFAQYIEAQLKAFRLGARANDPNGMMRGVAARLTDPEIKAVAEYTAGLR